MSCLQKRAGPPETPLSPAALDPAAGACSGAECEQEAPTWEGTVGQGLRAGPAGGASGLEGTAAGSREAHAWGASCDSSWDLGVHSPREQACPAVSQPRIAQLRGDTCPWPRPTPPKPRPALALQGPLREEPRLGAGSAASPGGQRSVTAHLGQPQSGADTGACRCSREERAARPAPSRPAAR